MAEHKVRTQSRFSRARTAFSRQVTLTCLCGKKFLGHYQGSQRDEGEYLETKALQNAEQAFRAHIPIR